MLLATFHVVGPSEERETVRGTAHFVPKLSHSHLVHGFPKGPRYHLQVGGFKVSRFQGSVAMPQCTNTYHACMMVNHELGEAAEFGTIAKLVIICSYNDMLCCTGVQMIHQLCMPEIRQSAFIKF